MKNRMAKKPKTLTFDAYVLDKLEKRCKEEKVPVSVFVNMLVRRHVMGEVAFHVEMAKYHNSKMQEHLFMKEQALILIK